MSYAYLIGWSKYDKFYYGVRISDSANPNDLWKTYFTSSNLVKKFLSENGNPDIIEIRKTFINKEDCVRWEKRVLTRINAKDNPRFLNRSNGMGSFQTNKGTIPVKEAVTGLHIGRVQKDDHRVVSGELVHVSTGVARKPWSQEAKQKQKQRVSDPGYKEKHSKSVRDSMRRPETIKKLKDGHKLETCIHCGVRMKRPAITNYHQDNCKSVNPSTKAPAFGRKWYNDGHISFMKLDHEVQSFMVPGRLKEK